MDKIRNALSKVTIFLILWLSISFNWLQIYMLVRVTSLQQWKIYNILNQKKTKQRHEILTVSKTSTRFLEWSIFIWRNTKKIIITLKLLSRPILTKRQSPISPAKIGRTDGRDSFLYRRQLRSCGDNNTWCLGYKCSQWYVYGTFH